MEIQPKQSILLVEDEVIIAMAEKQKLEQRGYAVLHAASGEAAVRLALESGNAFDIILMDIDLGSGMDGTKAAEEILRYKDIAVLFVSSHSEPEIVEKTEGITSYGYVLKNSPIVVIDASIKMALKLFREKMVRTQAEEALRVSEEKLSATMLSIGDAVITCGVDGAVVNLNPVAERLTGWDSVAAAGLPIEKVFHIVNAESRKDAENPVFRALDAGIVVGLANHTVLISRNGREYQIADSCAPIRKSDGQVLGAVLVFRDMTEEYRQNEELLKTQLIVKNIPTGLHLYHLEDLSDDSTLRMVYANPAVGDLTGIGPDTIVGKTLDENFPGLRELGIPQRYAEVVRTQTPVFFDDVVYGDDKVIKASFSVKAFPLPGNHVGVAFDNITERKKAEDELGKSLAQYASIFESSGTAMVLLAEDGSISAANRECVELTGYGLEELIGTSWERYTTPEMLGIMRQYREQRLVTSEGVPGKYETQLVDKQGCVRDVIVSVGLLSGTKRCVVAMLDITERKRTEETLRKNEENLNLLLELAPDAFLHGDERGNLIGANLKACEMFGYSREELLSMNIKDLFPPKELEAKPLRYDLLKDGAIIKIERRIRRKNGEIIDIEMNSRKMPDGKHQSFIRDITERKRFEEALRESEELFRALHQASYGGIAIHDHGVIIECNQGMSDMTGYSMEELLGMDGLLLIAERARPEVINKIQAGYEEPYESVGLRKDGSEYPLRIHGRNIHYKGKLVRTTEFRDMTDIKQVEEELRVQLKEKETLLREVHHRIKNNMSSVASLLSLQANSTSNEEARELLLESVRRVQSVTNIYDKLLHGTDYKEVSIKAYVEDLLDLVEDVFIKGKRIAIQKCIEDFRIDSKKAVSVGIIINEILTNTFKYAFETRESGNVSVEIRKEGSVVSIVIQDDGIGLSTARNTEETSGLGLYLVRILVEQLHGIYKTESGKGLKTFIQFNL